MHNRLPNNKNENLILATEVTEITEAYVLKIENPKALGTQGRIPHSLLSSIIFSLKTSVLSGAYFVFG